MFYIHLHAEGVDFVGFNDSEFGGWTNDCFFLTAPGGGYSAAGGEKYEGSLSGAI